MKNLLKKFLLLIVLFISAHGYAKCTRTANVKYMTKTGWSKLYTVNVTFLTGSELNRATGTYNYNSYSKYATIFWGENQASVIELSSVILSGFEIECQDIDNTLMDLEGKDQDGDNWNICLRDYCY